MFNPDFKDMLLALPGAKIKFLLVGAYAVAAHGHPRATCELDLWVHPDTETAPKVYRVLADFGSPLHDLTIGDLAKPGMVFQIGVGPPELTSRLRFLVRSLIMRGRIECPSNWTVLNFA